MNKCICLILVCGLLNSGCLSMMNIEKSKEELVEARVYEVDDPEMIHAFSTRGSAGVGIKITDFDALVEHPFRTLGAAVADVGVGWGLTKLAETLLSNIIYIKGDNNTVNTGK